MGPVSAVPEPSARPTLIAVAHGTRKAPGLAEIRRLIEVVRSLRPDLRVELAWLEQADPLLPAVLAAVTGPAVVVPALLSTGYHVKTDITRAVAGRPRTVVAAQLGPDDRLTDLVHDRLVAARAATGRAAAGRAAAGSDRASHRPGILLLASGSSDPEAAEQAETVGRGLAERAGVAVLVRYLNDPNWRAGVPDGVEVANYLLAPGFFDDRLQERARELSAPAAAQPLGADPAVARVLLDRYEALASSVPASTGPSSRTP